VIGVGALGQSSLKRMLAYSSVGQAGYMLAGIVVSTQLGVRATTFYLLVYLLMNMAAFAVIVARERETGLGDSVASLNGLGRERPLLAWPLTLSMLGLAGIPATTGFVGKVYLIEAAVNGSYTWLGIAIAIGSMISLGYYLPVIAAMWMREAPSGQPRGLSLPPRDEGPAAAGELPALAGGSPELDPAAEHPAGYAGAGQPPDPLAPAITWPELGFVAVLAAAGTIFFGIIPQPLFDLVDGVGRGFGLF